MPFFGHVLMGHTANGWIVQDQFGRPINTQGSTSEGLQEGINWAHDHGYALEVYGGPETGIHDNSVITSTMPIRIPPGAKGTYHFKGLTLWLKVPPDQDGINIDSQDMLDFDFGGQIVYQSNYSALGLVAANTFNEGNTPFQVFTSSRIRIMSIAIVDANGIPTKAQGTGLSINPGMGPFSFVTIDINEINGGATPWVVYPGSTFDMTYNIRGMH